MKPRPWLVQTWKRIGSRSTARHSEVIFEDSAQAQRRGQEPFVPSLRRATGKKTYKRYGSPNRSRITDAGKVRKRPRFFELKTYRIYFDFDTDVLDSDAKASLDYIVGRYFTAGEIFRIRCEGHTDSVGTTAYNDSLSRRRADAVRDYLIAQNIAPHRLIAVGNGERRPEVSNTTEKRRARNRRVQFQQVLSAASKEGE